MNYTYTLSIIFFLISCNSDNQNEVVSIEENLEETIEKSEIKTITYHYYNAKRIEHYDTLGNRISEYYIVAGDTLESKQYILKNGKLITEYRIEMNDTIQILQYEYSLDGSTKKIYSIVGDTIQAYGTYYIDENGNEYANSWRHKVRGLEDTNSYWYDKKGNMIKSHYYFGGETKEFKYDDDGNLIAYLVTIDSKYLDYWHLDLEHPELQKYKISYVFNNNGDWVESTHYIVSEPYENDSPRIDLSYSRSIEYYDQN